MSFKILDSSNTTYTITAINLGNATTEIMQSVPTNSLGSAMIGSATSANSLPVVIASDQATLTTVVSNTPLVNLTAIGGVAFTLGAQGSAASLPVVLATNQQTITTIVTNIITSFITGTPPVNLTAVGGSAITLGAAGSAASIPVVLATNQAAISIVGGNVSTTLMLRGATTSGTTSAVTLITAQGAGSSIYVTGLQFGNTSSTVFVVVTMSDQQTSAFLVPGGAPLGLTFATPLRTAAASALTFTLNTSVATVYASAQGYYGP